MTERKRFPVCLMLLFLAIVAVPMAVSPAEQACRKMFRPVLAACASGACPSSSRTEKKAWMLY